MEFFVMCGICGFVGPADPEISIRMRDSLTHRGPDEAGNCYHDGVYLGHRRLAIVDPNTGQQPIHNEDRTIALVFNGEIYNHQDLRRRLEPLGHHFATASDSESIVHAYEEYGTKCVEHFEGMFALVLHDRRRKILFGARDRMGQKPIYYTARPLGEVSFAFASELKALREHPAIKPRLRLCEDGLISYLLSDYVVGSGSIHQDIRRLEPGCAFVYGLSGAQQEGFRQWRYWDLDLCHPDSSPSSPEEREAGEHLLQLLADSVERRLMSDVPLGVFLSGGIDSSIIVALLTRHRPAQQIKTFAIGFDEPTFDESQDAERIARHFGTDHHCRRFTASNCIERIPQLVATLDEPIADPSILPLSMLCEFARERVTVALGGDGGDELLAGYDPFRALRASRLYRQLVPRRLHEKLVLPLASRLPVSDANMSLQFKVARFLRGAVVDPRYRLATWMGAFSLEQLRQLLPDLAHRLEPANAYHPMITAYENLDRAGADDIQLGLDFFQRFYLPDDILVKVDRASMMHSLEVRSPFLDTTLVEYVNSLPSHFKYRPGRTKYLLKQAVAHCGGSGLIPKTTIFRRKKGFGIPVARWIRHEMASQFREVLLEAWPRQLDMFDRQRIERLMHLHNNRDENLSKELWALFMLAKWATLHLS